MAIITLTFPPGTVAVVSGGGTVTVNSVNATSVVLNIDDVNNDGLISNDEWDAFIGAGGGNDTGSGFYLFQKGAGSSGTLYATNGTPFTVGQNVTAITSGLSNTFDADVTAVAPPPICFTRGTRILTQDGQRSIEDLRVGDKVVTRAHGLNTVQWIGCRKISRSQLVANPQFYPVRIKNGALGRGLPDRDLVVSRQHRMLVSSKIAQRMFGCPEVLISAIKLTVLPEISVDVTVDGIEYFHILFDRHEIIFAENAPAESLYAGAEALKSIPPEARAELFTLFPELAGGTYVPAPAVLIPPVAQQRKLVARHAKNHKPVLA